MKGTSNATASRTEPAGVAATSRSAEAAGGALDLRPIPIDQADAREPLLVKRSAAHAGHRPPMPAATPTLTAFDWLDTIVDEMLIRGDKATDSGRVTGSGALRELSAACAGKIRGPGPHLPATAILNRVVLGYSPMIDRNCSVVATRLTVAPLRPGASLDAGELLREVGEVWPADGGTVSLNVSSELLLGDLLRAHPAANVMIEVPAFLAADPLNVDPLLALKANGNTLLLKGRPIRELPREVLPCFRWSIIDVAEDRRIGKAGPPPGTRRSIGHVQSGVRSLVQLRDSFEHGAVAVIGWPIDDPLDGAGQAGTHPDLQIVVEMINRIDRGDAIESLEATLLRDPALAFELLRHVDAPASGLHVETGSFRHAVMMLGYPQLRRWLALRLADAGDDNRLRPARFAAMRRGLLMRELAARGADDETRSELLMCGVFSLLDRVLRKPLGHLLQTLPVPERVRQALVDQAGPYFAMLELVRAIESEQPYEIRAAADALLLAPVDINHALLRALYGAAQLE